jgi:sarcosine oxidase subunit gamma
MAEQSSWLRLKAPAGRLILQGDAGARAVAAGVWGVPLSEQACRANRNEERASLWLGPDEHLLYQPNFDLPLPIDALEAALAPHPHSLVDVSHRQVGVEISGPNAALILAGACPLDLDLDHFPVQMCTRTVLGKAEIVLWRTASDVFHLEVWRSIFDYAHELLIEISRDCSSIA